MTIVPNHADLEKIVQGTGTVPPRALSNHLLTILEQERANLARELHDELGANLMIMRINLTTALEKFGKNDPDLATQLQETLQLLKKTVDIKRRIIDNLHPSMLEDFGLAASLRSYCEDIASCSGIQIDTKIEGDFTEIDSGCAIALYRIVQESLTNVVKYAKATRVSISLHQNKEGAKLCIADNGVGITEEVLKKPKTHGIFGMRERATLNGGSFNIAANKKGRGTRIDVFIPYLNCWANFTPPLEKA